MAKKQPKAIQRTKKEREALEIKIHTEWATKIKSHYDPASIALEISEMLEYRKSEDEGVKERSNSVLKSLISQLQTSEEFETFHSLVKSVEYDYKPMVFKFVRGLIEEYGLTTPSEKALAEIATNAHIRVLSVSARLNTFIWDTNTPTTAKGMYMSVLSKELDRANRTYIAAISHLKQMKSPQLRVNIKTKNAFVAQNQQINAGGKSNANPI